MTIAEYCEMMNEEFSDDIILAAVYLEAMGLRLGVDFGYRNALEKAEEIYAWESLL